MLDKLCRDCAYYTHIYDEDGLDAECGGLCHHADSLIHGVSGMTEPNGTCVRWTAKDDDLPFSDPPESDEPISRADVLKHLRTERAKGQRFVSLMDRFIAVVEKEDE